MKNITKLLVLLSLILASSSAFSKPIFFRVTEFLKKGSKGKTLVFLGNNKEGIFTLGVLGKDKRISELYFQGDARKRFKMTDILYKALVHINRHKILEKYEHFVIGSVAGTNGINIKISLHYLNNNKTLRFLLLKFIQSNPFKMRQIAFTQKDIILFFDAIEGRKK